MARDFRIELTEDEGDRIFVSTHCAAILKFTQHSGALKQEPQRIGRGIIAWTHSCLGRKVEYLYTKAECGNLVPVAQDMTVIFIQQRFDDEVALVNVIQ
jgi:hypothetical protein